MKKALALIATAALLAACSPESSTTTPAPAPAPTTPPASSAPAPAPAPEPTAPSSAAPAPSSTTAQLPAECQAYLDKVQACVSKQSGAAADAVKASMEQTRASWAALGADQVQLVSACKAASDAFAAQASAMNC